jgi:hypothetical protein
MPATSTRFPESAQVKTSQDIASFRKRFTVRLIPADVFTHTMH